MKYDDRYIVELSRAAIFDDTPFNPKEELNWNYIYSKSIDQNITGLLFTAINKLSDEYRPNTDLYAKWQKKMFETIAVTSRQYNEFSRMTKTISETGIKIVVLKGGFMRRIYPTPELRTMGDFDVLVKKSDLKKIANLFKSNGYEVNKAVFGVEVKNEKAFWEIFYVLEEEFVIAPEENTLMIYDNSVSVDSFFIPKETLFLSHMIVHTGKHYVEKGAGVRNLLDIALYISRYKQELDFDKISRLCAKQNYRKIHNYILSAVKQWYGVDLSDVQFDECDSTLFIEYTLLNGIFGKHGNVLLPQIAKPTDDSISGFRKLFFPTAKALENRYKYLRKSPFLLPIAWVHRFLSGIFFRKFSLKTMIKDLKEARCFSDERLKWLNDLNLKEEH
ncbi:MAG: nucleotidyltransferase family protein [Firmicutes bacterium]|nr:nucleotidyltransferase family protein [Bacillota bacterium]